MNRLIFVTGLAFAREVIRFAKTPQKDVLARPTPDQLIRSATSIGANFVEAKNGSPKKDFRNRVYIK